ncbi:hypothetical protein Tco_0210222 [Tanacetum coccineum]
MLVQPTEDEGEASERPYESQPIPSPSYPSEDQPGSQPDPSPRPSLSIPIPDSDPEGSGGNHGGQSSSDKSLSRNEDGLTLQKKVDAESVYIQTGEEKLPKSKPKYAHKDQTFDVAFDDLDAMDYMETEDAHNENGVSTEDQVSTVNPDEGTDKPKVSTDQLNVSTDKLDEGTTEPINGNSDENATPTATPTTTPTVFRDDETISKFLEEAESETESEGVNEAERKFAQVANDEEISRKVQEEWETEEEKKKLAEEEATKAALIRDYDDIHARIKADSILAARLQEEEREKFTIKERAKLLHDTIAAQRRFSNNMSCEIRSRPPIRTQLRNQMMTYLKHVRGKIHSDLKTKNFEEIQVLYEKVKRSDENFIAIGSAEDERIIKDVNKKATGTKKDDSIKEERKEEESTRKRKLGTRKKMKSRKRRFRQDTSQDDNTDSEKENDELRLCLTIALDEDKEVDYEILDKKYPIIEWKSKHLGIKPQYDEAKDLEEINLNVVIRSSGQRRYFSTWGDCAFHIDRDDLNGVSLRKKVLFGFWGGSQVQMLELKLESEEDNTMAWELIRFVKKLITELEPVNSDGNEKDL